jgi:hypothetical protein
MFDVSLVPVLVSTVVAVFIGMVWYSERMFGHAWMREADIDASGMNGDGAGKAILAGVFQNFVIVYILSHILLIAEAYPNAGPLFGAMWASILVGATQLGAVIWERRSLTYYMINTGYLIIVILAASLILTMWPWA